MKPIIVRPFSPKFLEFLLSQSLFLIETGEFVGFIAGRICNRCQTSGEVSLPPLRDDVSEILHEVAPAFYSKSPRTVLQSLPSLQKTV